MILLVILPYLTLARGKLVFCFLRMGISSLSLGGDPFQFSFSPELKYRLCGFMAVNRVLDTALQLTYETKM